MSKIITTLLICFSFLLSAVSVFSNEGNIPVASITDASIPRKDITEPAVGHELFATDSLIAENRNLQLYLDKQNFAIKIRDLSNNFVWSSSISEEELEAAMMSLDWTHFSKSAIVIDYMDSSAGTVRRSFSSKARVEHAILDNGFTSHLQFNDAELSFDVIVTLEKDGINVSIPNDTIVLGEKFILSRIFVLPFLGASHADTNDGYIFIPDGSGALMRFSAPKLYTTSYSARVYGADYGTRKVADTNSRVAKLEDVKIPVLGMVHGANQNAFISIITDGDVYASIEANPAGNMIDYFWTAPSFIFNELYWQPTSERAGFFALPSEPNPVNINVKYKFLAGDSANYVGMANRYKEYLIETGELLKNNSSNQSDIPLKVDALMSETKNALFGKSTQVMTRMSDLIDWVDYFHTENINNISMRVAGYQQKGYNGHKLNDTKINKKIGCQTEATMLFNNLANAGGELYFDVNPSKGYTSQLSQRNVVYNIDGSIVNSFLNGPVFDEQYYNNVAEETAIVSNTNSSRDYFQNISFRSIGNILFSDYARKSSLSRYEVKLAKEHALSLAGANGNIELEAPNVYALKFANQVYDMPISTSMHVYETDRVPFLQIVLSGYVDSFSPYINLGTNSKGAILKLIDYNTYPAYLLTDAYAHDLAKTNLSHLYSTKFDQWKNDIVQDYEYINNILNKVRDAEIISREVIEDGFVVVGYSSGQSIVINYNEEDISYMGIFIEGKSAKAIRGGV